MTNARRTSGFRAAGLDVRAWLAWLSRLPAVVVSSSAYWALIVLVTEWQTPALVLPTVGARLRWVLLAGVATALLRDPPLGWWRFGDAPAEGPLTTAPRAS